MIVTVNSLVLLQAEGLVGARCLSAGFKFFSGVVGSSFVHSIVMCCDVNF